MLDQISRSDYAEIVVIVKNGDFKESTDSSLQKLVKNRRHLLYILLARFDAWSGKPKPDPMAVIDIGTHFPNVRRISVSPKETPFSHYLSEDDAELVRSFDLDVLIRLGFKIIRGDFLKCAKYGIWSYHHGDNRINRGVPPGFWEVFEQWPATGVVLQVLTEDLDGGLILSRSYSQTNFSLVSRNVSNHYWKSLSLLPRALKQLHRWGPERFFAKVKEANQHPEFYSRRLRLLPGNFEVVRLALIHYWRYLWIKLTSFFYFKQWILLYDITRDGRMSRSFWRFKKIIPNRNLGWGDPFVVFRNNQYYVFLEELPGDTNKGHISYMTIDRNGNRSEPKKILEKPYHLSYPFVFVHEGTDYMIPESFENGTIDLYRCVEFPDKWQFQMTLMRNVRAVDSTVIQHEGRWWLFANIRENEGAASEDELFLFYALDLLTEDWTPHPMNPIVSDVRSARPAGRIFEHEGKLYRPSQNNSRFYANGMKINHIVKLSTTEYEETCVSEIDPGWDKSVLGTHTLNHACGLTVIDGIQKRNRYFG
jgi:hypothetical protein